MFYYFIKIARGGLDFKKGRRKKTLFVVLGATLCIVAFSWIAEVIKQEQLRMTSLTAGQVCGEIVKRSGSFSCDDFHHYVEESGMRKTDSWDNDLLCESSGNGASYIVSLGADGDIFGSKGDADVRCYKNSSVITSDSLSLCSCEIRSQ